MGTKTVRIVYDGTLYRTMKKLRRTNRKLTFLSAVMIASLVLLAKGYFKHEEELEKLMKEKGD